MELTTLGRNGVALVEDIANGYFYIDGSGGTAANTVNATLTAASATRQTNDGATAEVDLILPPAIPNETREFYCLAAQIFKPIAGGTDKIFWGQTVPSGGTHVYASEVNAYLRLMCVKLGQWHVAGHEGAWSIG